jgi:hypothetical protein
MFNITLTITAAPELLAVVSNFANSITCAKVVAVPQATPNTNPTYNQGNTAPVNPVNSQVISVPVNAVQAQQQAPSQAPEVQTSGVPTSTSALTYTMEQLAVAATQLVDAGRRAELVNLLNTFGVQALTLLPKELYGAFATQLRALGAKI